MTIALAGVMGMQLYFLGQAYELNSKQFDQSVNQALGNAVDKLQKLDANNFLNTKIEIHQKKGVNKSVNKPYLFVSANNTKPKHKKRKKPFQSYAVRLGKEQHKADSIFSLRDSLFRLRNPEAISFNDVINAAELQDMDYKLHVNVYQFEDALGQVHQKTEQTLSRALSHPALSPKLASKSLKTDSVLQYIVFDSQYGPRLVTFPRPKLTSVSLPPVKDEERKANHVKRVKEYVDATKQNKDVFKDLYTEYQQVYVPLSERIHPATLDSILRNELQSQAIFSNYEFKVTSAKQDSVIFTQASNKTGFLPYNSYKTPLFPKDMIRDSGMLLITFPDKSNIILSNLTAMMGLSGGLLLVLIFCFGYTIHSILKQKKLSEMKTDFINNMTHEFKTPVATIMLASEALKDPELVADKKRVDKLAGIIYDENIRLGNHIERVLNIAKIDKGDLKLERKEVEINDLLAAIIDSMALQLQKRNATVNLQLNAKRAMVWGDELHLSNVIFNLLDNANKYSAGDPEIQISTSNSGNNLIIKVADKGIGMNRDQLSKIFEQFYRIPTGNLHDVKGFGLGLSYVNNIIKRLNGTVRVKSEKDKGSEFEISIPLA